MVPAAGSATDAPRRSGPEASTAPTAEPDAAPSMCDLVCERARVVSRASDPPDYTALATANANRVLGAIRADLLACYERRLVAKPRAHGFITLTIVVAPGGTVQSVDTTGGAILGEATMACIVKRIERATFDPPHAGGTLTIEAPFSLRRVADDSM